MPRGPRFFLVLAVLWLGALPCRAADVPPTPPTGLNVHLVVNDSTHLMWRGGAPRIDTVRALQKAAAARHVTVTFIDLRHPANLDDVSGRGGRLSPVDEEKLARQSGLHYVSMSALDKTLLTRVQQALQEGDVYIHCMYGVNRTGFAVARYATARGIQVERTGMGDRDWRQGEAFQHRQKQSPAAPAATLAK